jgi:hypothetical protein
VLGRGDSHNQYTNWGPEFIPGGALTTPSFGTWKSAFIGNEIATPSIIIRVTELSPKLYASITDVQAVLLEFYILDHNTNSSFFR